MEESKLRAPKFTCKNILCKLNLNDSRFSSCFFTIIGITNGIQSEASEKYSHPFKFSRFCHIKTSNSVFYRDFMG